VSDGAVSFYLDRFVRSRVSKITYGTFCHIQFDPASPDHQQRLGKTFTSVSGKRRVRDAFDVILPKVHRPFAISPPPSSLNLSCSTRKLRRLRNSRLRISGKPSLRRSSEPQPFLCGAIAELWRSPSGKMLIPVTSKFPLRLSRIILTSFYTENYNKLCTIDIDLSHLPLTPLSRPSGGGRYYRLDYDIVLLFGLTELKALVAWKQNVRFSLIISLLLSLNVFVQGVERRSETKIVYDPDPRCDD